VPTSNFWSSEERRHVLKEKSSQSELERRKAVTLSNLDESDLKIPIQIVFRNASTGTASSWTGADLFVPNGFGTDFWLALQYGTARAAGLKDGKAIEFESRRLNFPDDVLDCQAGRLAVAKEKIHLEEKYQKRPHNRRTLYQSKLHIDHPFSFEWQTLLPSMSNGKNSPHSSLYVLRNRRQLDLLDKWMRGKQTKPEEIFQLHGASALVPINVECLSRGVPRRFALIVLPTLVDLENYRTANQKGEKFILTENEMNSS